MELESSLLLPNPADCKSLGTRTGGGSSGASLKDAVSRLSDVTVVNTRKPVSTKEHLVTGQQLKMLLPNGIKSAARQPSTTVPCKSRPELHLLLCIGKIHEVELAFHSKVS